VIKKAIRTRKKCPAIDGPGKGFETAMVAYLKREDSRKRFPQVIKRNRPPVAGIAAVRHVGPRWIIAGRRPRSVAVFFVRTTLLSARAAP
jgi:hypothetical protein